MEPKPLTAEERAAITEGGILPSYDRVVESEAYYRRMFAESDPRDYYLNGATWIRIAQCRYCKERECTKTCPHRIAKEGGNG